MSRLENPRWRIGILAGVLILVYLIMGIKAFREQIRLGDEHENAVKRQSIRRIRIPAKRGKIFTSDLKILAESVVSYDVNFYFEEMRQPGRPSKTVTHALAVYKLLCEKIGREPEVGQDALEYHIFNRPGLPLTVFSNLTDREMTQVYKLAAEYPGIEVVANSLRYYPNFDLAAHLVGYAQKQDPALAEDRKDFFYYQSDLVGKIGLEKYCDSFTDLTLRGLRGDAGREVVRVDNFGFIREVLDKTEDTSNGNNVVLTIDSRAQAIAENLLRGNVGAMVVLNADTGEVLAMTSQPSYNLNLFSPWIGRVRYTALAQDEQKPLFNRALYGSYMPGSILKVLACLAFLENGVNPNEEMVCDGETIVSGVKIRCASYRSGGHGRVNLYTALEKSCNDYLIEHAVAVGLDELVKQYAAAGIGESTGFELGGADGLLPSKAGLKQRERRNWSNADTGFVSIGQGMVEITPLQAAVYTAAIANGGNIMRPFIVKKIVDDKGVELYKTMPAVRRRLAASPAHIAMVKEGMFQVVNAPHGTGRRAYSDIITLYGKTGTAEFGRKPNLRNNSFFICFGEYNNVRYSMFILQENGAGGGRDCAPLATEFFKQYLN